MNSTAKICLFSLVAGLFSFGCVDTPNFSQIPEIAFVGFTKDTILQGSFQEDSLTVFISFKDGDGDLGDDPSNVMNTNNVFVIDERTGFQDNSFRIPKIPTEGSANGIEGTIKLVFFSTCCIFDSGIDPCEEDPDQLTDEVQYRIYLTDRAGHTSNEIVTAPITLLCN